MYIYIITNTLNNKCYVGKTINLPINRFYRHMSGNGNIYLNSDVQRYGKSAFTFKYHAFNVDADTLSKIETYYISMVFNSIIPNGYNVVRSYNQRIVHRHPAWQYENEICELYRYKDMSVMKLAEQFGCSDGLISNILKHNDVETRDQSTKSPLWGKQSEICELFDNGTSIKELADYLECSMPLIRNILNANGVETPKSKYIQPAWQHQELICKIYLDHELPIKTLSKRFQCSSGVIRRILNENGVEPRRSGRPTNI